MGYHYFKQELVADNTVELAAILAPVDGNGKARTIM